MEPFTSITDRLERQQQAMKGLVQTLPSLRERYCEILCGRPRIAGDQTTPAMRHLSQLVEGNGQIFEAVTGVNSLHTCIAHSVVSSCTARAFRALPGAQGNQELEDALAPLDHIVSRKVWSQEERAKLFKLCFEILENFGAEFADLIQEVRSAFPEETKDIEASNKEVAAA